MNTNPYLNAFYQSYDEDSRLAPRHGSVEFLTTMRYIERYIQPGDRVVVRAGSIIPLDGVVAEGEVTVNQASLTGESVPVAKRPGGAVYAGTVVEEGVFPPAGDGEKNVVPSFPPPAGTLAAEKNFLAGKAGQKMISSFSAGCGRRNSARRSAG